IMKDYDLAFSNTKRQLHVPDPHLEALFIKLQIMSVNRESKSERMGKQAAAADHFRIPVFAPQYEDETDTDPKAKAMFGD
nr:hypothetical protein [Tanacetum cinerariifolium]